MPRIAKKRSEAKSEYNGFSGWLRDRLDIPECAEISAKDDGSMHGGVRVTVTFPEGEEVEFGGYFSKPPAAHYVVTPRNKHKEQIREYAEQHADA